ncbi:MAG: helix-turn-helix domain-containing protein [Bryobacteraceae bacterium]
MSGVAGALLALLAYVAPAYPQLLRWRDANLLTLSEISCTGAKCDSSAFSTDWESDSSDYVLDTQNRFFMNMPTPTAAEPGQFPPLHYSDTTFIAGFRQPSTYNTPDGEVWRLYSRAVVSDAAKSFEILVGYAEKAPWKAIETPGSLLGDVDAVLRREADKIASRVSAPRAAARFSRSGISVDGFQVVDPHTKRVLEQGPWIPAFLPKGVPRPSPGLELYIYEGGLYAAQTDTDGRLLATSFVEVGGLWWMACSCAIGFLCASLIARALSRRFLRNYFAITGMQVPSIQEAVVEGENQRVEFKRGLSDAEDRAGDVEEEMLRSIAAFANTNDGVVLVGIDDAGHVKGLGLDFAQRDRLERKVHQLVRNRIKPRPPVQITFETIRGYVVARIAVARGEAPVYMLGGAVYLRDGSSDVQAQPDELVRLVSQYAS